jgi:hypothetical protein
MRVGARTWTHGKRFSIGCSLDAVSLSGCVVRAYVSRPSRRCRETPDAKRCRGTRRLVTIGKGRVEIGRRGRAIETVRVTLNRRGRRQLRRKRGLRIVLRARAQVFDFAGTLHDRRPTRLLVDR